jgi:hypothetical protein
MSRNGNGDPGMRLLLIDRLGGPSPHGWMRVLLNFCGFSSTSLENSCNSYASHQEYAHPSDSARPHTLSPFTRGGDDEIPLPSC